MFGGAGNDLMVYDNEDAIIDGGAGIDFLLTDKPNLDLANLGNVSNVEVLLTVGSDKIKDLTSIADLAKECGITLTDTNRDGNADGMTLTKADTSGNNGWMVSGTGYEHHDASGNVDLTMNVDPAAFSTIDSTTDPAVIAFTIANSNG